MITIIHGKPGAGKTALMTAYGCERMTTTARDFVLPARREIEKLNKGGFKLSLPDRHLVFADYDIIAKKEGMSQRLSYEADGYRFGLPAKDFDAQFFAPYSTLLFDEGQKYWNSRKSNDKSNGIPENVSRAFEMHRHNNLDVFIACQRPGLIDRNIRDLCKRFIEVQSMKLHYDKGGEIIGVTWHGLEFDDVYEVEAYLSGGRASAAGRKMQYTHEGNIFESYDSYNFKAFFYKDRYDADFDMKPCGITTERKQNKSTVEYIKNFNQKKHYIKEAA